MLRVLTLVAVAWTVIGIRCAPGLAQNPHAADLVGEWRWEKAFSGTDMILNIRSVESDGTVLGNFDTQYWGEFSLGPTASIGQAAAKLDGDILHFEAENGSAWRLTIGPKDLHGTYFRASDKKTIDARFVKRSSRPMQYPALDPQVAKLLPGEWRWVAAFQGTDMILRITGVAPDGVLEGVYDTQNWGRYELAPSQRPKAVAARVTGREVRIGFGGNFYDLNVEGDRLRGTFYRYSDNQIFDAVFSRHQ